MPVYNWDYLEAVPNIEALKVWSLPEEFYAQLPGTQPRNTASSPSYLKLPSCNDYLLNSPILAAGVALNTIIARATEGVRVPKDFIEHLDRFEPLLTEYAVDATKNALLQSSSSPAAVAVEHAFNESYYLAPVISSGKE